MPTVVKTIGSGGGRDYSTLSGWAAALPANLVTDGNSYVGECYNDSEFTNSFNVLLLSGHTTDASHYITLTTGAGQSFRDNAGVQSNALRYNAANGVGIRTTAGVYAVGVEDQYTVLSNLQIQNDSASYLGNGLYIAFAGSAYITVDNCIVSSKSTVRPALNTGTTNRHRNSLIVQSGGVPPIWEGKANINSGGTYYFCTIVAPSDASTPAAGIVTDYGSPSFENCAFFGCTAVYEHDLGGGAPSFTTCMTDVASPPSGVTGGKPYASQFQNTTIASGDWREKAAADLRGAATAEATHGATDIAGTSRPQGANWDIGCWELPASGTIVIADTWGLVGLLAEHRVACRSRCELVATQRADPRLVLHLSVMQHADLTARLEWKASLRRDLHVAVEFESGVSDNSASFIELSARSFVYWDAVTESQSAIISLLIDESVLPIEWSVLPVAVRVSLERLLASPGKRRILGTPGRLRLLKRD